MQCDGTWDDDDADQLCEQIESDGAGFDLGETYTPAADGGSDETGWRSDDHKYCREPAEEYPEVIFTVTSPSGSLSASAGLGGRIQRIDVIDVSSFDEVQLREEIFELALLAREKARAAQHEVTAELMRRLGQDRVGVSSFLLHLIGLPTFESASAQLAETFAIRYRSDDD